MLGIPPVLGCRWNGSCSRRGGRFCSARPEWPPVPAWERGASVLSRRTEQGRIGGQRGQTDWGNTHGCPAPRPGPSPACEHRGASIPTISHGAGVLSPSPT